MSRQQGRERTLENTLATLNKRFGEGTVMRLGDAQLNVESIPTGSLSLDIALGVGGVPRGRVIEIYGPESSGKTTLCQHIIAEAQTRGGLCAFVDMEHALDPHYAARCGVDVENLYISQPDTGEQALEIAEALIRSGTMDVVVIDSVAALVPRAEIEGEMGDSHMGLQARLMSQALRKMSGIIKQTNTVVVFTNQLRMKIGVMFGNPETTVPSNGARNGTSAGGGGGGMRCAAGRSADSATVQRGGRHYRYAEPEAAADAGQSGG
jgi:recombination protein RecA